MSEEEILKIMKNLVLMPCDWKITDKYDGKIDFIGSLEGNEAVQGLLDLYNNTKKSELILANKFQKVNIELNKEKEKNKELENKLNQMYNKQLICDIDEINRSHISFN